MNEGPRRDTQASCNSWESLQSGSTDEKTTYQIGGKNQKGQSTFFRQGSVEERQQPRLPEGVAAVHQFVAAALEAAFEAHLSADHPPLGTDANGVKRAAQRLPGALHRHAEAERKG